MGTQAAGGWQGADLDVFYVATTGQPMGAVIFDVLLLVTEVSSYRGQGVKKVRGRSARRTSGTCVEWSGPGVRLLGRGWGRGRGGGVRVGLGIGRGIWGKMV